MSVNPAYDPTDPRYYDGKDLRAETERIFSVCADCRLCVRYCGSFPKLFDAIDSYCTDEQYAEVDAKKLKTGDVDEIVDLCFQCKLCYIKCPYTPGTHDWAIDFPRLMARAKAKKVKDRGVPFADKVLGNPDLAGKLGTATSALANWANESKLHRQFMQSILGIHKDKKLPPFASKTLAARTIDPMEFLAKLAAEGKLNKEFKTGAGDVNYHMPCHLRAQNVGYKTRDVLSLLPNTKVKVVEECSGHDGTWAMKKENFEASLKWGKRAFAQMAEGEPDITCSDCPLAAIQIEQGTGRRPLNPIQIVAKSYRGEKIS